MVDLSLYRKNPSVISTDLDGSAILLNLDTKYYYNLNETGFKVWQLLDESTSAWEIGKKLVDEYDVDLETVIESLSGIMKKLERENLILFRT